MWSRSISCLKSSIVSSCTQNKIQSLYLKRAWPLISPPSPGSLLVSYDSAIGVFSLSSVTQSSYCHIKTFAFVGPFTFHALALALHKSAFSHPLGPCLDISTETLSELSHLSGFSTQLFYQHLKKKNFFRTLQVCI